MTTTQEPPSSSRAARASQPKATGGPAFRKTELARFLLLARKAAGLRGRVELLLADDAALAELNRTFRRRNKPTDVLSFPAMAMPGQRSAPAGDLAISVETAARQAAEHGHSLEAELKILILHGVLHLAGHDHETDNGQMLRMEQRLRRQLGLPVGLIERASPTATPIAAPMARRRTA